MLGLKEFADALGWKPARLSTKLHRQQAGQKVRPHLPEPVQYISATPLWTRKQAMEYKRLVESRKKGDLQ